MEEIKEIRRNFNYLWYYDIYEEVYRIIKKIPLGKITTYSIIAEKLGDKRYATRSIGEILNKNPLPFLIPCHRVIRSDGTLGGYKYGKELKKKLLIWEGIRIKGDKIVNFEKYLYKDLPYSGILKHFRYFQKILRNFIKLEDKVPMNIKYIGSFDVSYITLEDKEFGIGGIVVFDLEKKEIVERVYCIKEMLFPYIPTYLAFREFPLFDCTYENLEIKPDVFFIDGNGYLHPYRLGIATFIGILKQIPTIGVAKKLLVGSITKTNYITHNNEVIGFLYKIKNKKFYISPGNFITLERSISLFRKFYEKFKEDPIIEAHKFVNRIKKSTLFLV